MRARGVSVGRGFSLPLAVAGPDVGRGDAAVSSGRPRPVRAGRCRRLSRRSWGPASSGRRSHACAGQGADGREESGGSAVTDCPGSHATQRSSEAVHEWLCTYPTCFSVLRVCGSCAGLLYLGQCNAPCSLMRDAVCLDARANLIAANEIDYASHCGHATVRQRAEPRGLLQY